MLFFWPVIQLKTIMHGQVEFQCSMKHTQGKMLQSMPVVQCHICFMAYRLVIDIYGFAGVWSVQSVLLYNAMCSLFAGAALQYVHFHLFHGIQVCHTKYCFYCLFTSLISSLLHLVFSITHVFIIWNRLNTTATPSNAGLSNSLD